MPNRRDLIKFTLEEREQFLNKNLKAALATIDKNGFPHVVAMNYFYVDGAIYMTSFGKAQKVVNIRRNPKVGVMVETGRTYGDLQGVMIRGHCEIIEEPERVRESMRAMRGRQGPQATVPRDASTSMPKRVVLKIVPEKVTSWDHTKLGGRY
jgi:nitroimidazol reductase NimA-like FMN-containing flavoprotein (pyridoxamine 5'-phosphate oxidase superfamily)